jgi:hypothetical protein
MMSNRLVGVYRHRRVTVLNVGTNGDEFFFRAKYKSKQDEGDEVMTEVIQEADVNAISKLTNDLKKAARTLTDKEARYLVDGYYALQGYRVATGNQIFALNNSKEPNEVLRWFFDNAEVLEGQMKRALNAYSDTKVVGRWSKSICGIGPVIAAGLLAHIEMYPWRCTQAKADQAVKACSEKEPHPGGTCSRQPLATAGQIWRFAGLDPTDVWNKGEKRPWNASLKTLCWKIGESFVKVHNNDSDYYGKLYTKRKEWETAKNANHDYADQAADKLKKFDIGKSTDAYKAYIQGLLPDGRIHARAKRYAVKIFLSHWHAVAYESTFNKPAPIPYIIAYDKAHTHMLKVPNWPMSEE